MTVIQGLLQHLTLLVNKFLPVSSLDAAAALVLQEVPNPEVNTSWSARYGMAMFAVARGLVWRLYRVDDILHMLFSLVRDPSSGAEAARSFEVLYASDEVLSRERGAVIRPLAKQRIFSISLPIIANAVREPEFAVKNNHLLALCAMLKHVDTSLLFPEMATVVPLLLQIMDLEDGAAKSGAIRVLAAMVQEDPSALEHHAASLTNRLLKITTSNQANDMVSGSVLPGDRC